MSLDLSLSLFKVKNELNNLASMLKNLEADLKKLFKGKPKMQEIKEDNWIPITNIVEWAYSRGLLPLDPKDIQGKSSQMIKLTEEVGELANGVSKQDLWEIADAIGDCMVVLIIMAHQHGLTATHCLDVAYQEIKDRKGTLKDGYYVKE